MAAGEKKFKKKQYLRDKIKKGERKLRKITCTGKTALKMQGIIEMQNIYPCMEP